MTGLVDNLEQPIEDTTMGQMTAGLFQTGKAAIGLPKKIKKFRFCTTKRSC